MRKLLLFFILVTLSQISIASIFTLDFSYNRRMQNFSGSGASNFPQGLTTLGGIDFAIPDGGNNIWHSIVAGASNPISLSVSVDKYGVDSVYSLINTYWGDLQPGTFASINFFGSNGAFYTKFLDGNIDIRDYLSGNWTNSISASTTQNVFVSGASRLDMVTVDLPDEFLTQTLTTIQYNDYGSSEGAQRQRIFLAGVSVDALSSSVPLPGGGWLFISGLFLLWYSKLFKH